MTLIKSISGIRGTIGGKVSENLTPIDIVNFTSAFTYLLRNKYDKTHLKIVVGRDARISGEMVESFVINTLVSLGVDVINLSLSTTPTVEIAVPIEQADGGIIITASHNPKEWNALKLLNEKGEFINAEDGKQLIELANNKGFQYAEVEKLGVVTNKDNYIDIHIQQVLNMTLVNTSAIRKLNFKVVVDAVNSTGGIAVPKLLKELNAEVIELYCTPNGDFPHNPEPLDEHLRDIKQKVIDEKADLGVVVDPDVDRLVFVCEDGSLFGEEYTLVACADYILNKNKGTVVSNLSSSRALKDVAKKHLQECIYAPVGEVNVVNSMKKHHAVIGGEGNGGVIYPESHYGRDALVGIALFLSHLSEKTTTVKQLKQSYPSYFMSKSKVELKEGTDTNAILSNLETTYKEENINTEDGLRIDFEDTWVHIRSSNTEPILRIYSEAKTKKEAEEITQKVIKHIKTLY